MTGTILVITVVSLIIVVGATFAIKCLRGDGD
jgi:hypothetical protein